MQKILLSIIVSFLLFSCSSTQTDSNISIIQKQFTYPILKLKDYNNVLQFVIKKKDVAKESVLKEIVIDLRGTTNLEIIKSAAIYYNDTTSGTLSEERKLFSKSDNISGIMKFSGDFPLTLEKNYFWFSIELKNNADLNNSIFCNCEAVKTNLGNATLHSLINPQKFKLGVALRKHNDDNVDTYRIPGLVTTNSGSLLAVYDVRRNSARDLQGDIDIGISRSTNNGNTWEPMRIAIDMKEWGSLPEKFNGVSDASLLVDKNSNNIFIAALWMHGVINKEGKWINNLTNSSEDWNHQWRNKGSQSGYDVKRTSQFLITKSINDGNTWGKPINLTRMCKKEEWWLWAPAPGNGITFDDGTLVLPTQGRDKNGVPFSNITYSKDDGNTWKTSNAASTNTTENSIVQLENGTVMINIRDNTNRKNADSTNGRTVATTNDLGNTWVTHNTSHNALIESTCMASLYKHEYIKDKQKHSILLFSNPNTKVGRHHITLKVSFDNGETWPKKNWILLDEGSSRGYSSITGLNNGDIGILYESSQADLVFQKVPLSDIISKNNTN